jgi:hypothetical protein
VGISSATVRSTVTDPVSEHLAVVRDLAWGECFIVGRTRRAPGNALLRRHSDDVASLEWSERGWKEQRSKLADPGG